MHPTLLLLTLLSFAPHTELTVLNPARVLDQPHYWAQQAKHGGLERGMKVEVLRDEGAWLYVAVKPSEVRGFVPRTAVEDTLPVELHFDGPPPKTASAAQAANASRGFSEEVHGAEVKKANLAEADARIRSYEDELPKRLQEAMPGFLSKGHLAGGAR